MTLPSFSKQSSSDSALRREKNQEYLDSSKATLSTLPAAVFLQTHNASKLPILQAKTASRGTRQIQQTSIQQTRRYQMTTQEQVPPQAGNSENSHTIRPKEGTLPGALPPTYPDDYVAGSVIPYLKSEIYQGEPPLLPMIEPAMSKEDALPCQFMGLLYDSWAPNSEKEGGTIFTTAYEKRGPHNLRKKIHMSALTPDLIETKYRDKIVRFFEQFLAESHDGKPMLENYFDNYFNLYWDFFVGARPDEIPDAVRQYSAAYSAAFGYWYPTFEIMQQSYMQARKWRRATREWVDDRVQKIADGKLPNADGTFVYYWLKNAGSGEYFRRIDIIFECCFTLLANSHW